MCGKVELNLNLKVATYLIFFSMSIYIDKKVFAFVFNASVEWIGKQRVITCVCFLLG